MASKYSKEYLSNLVAQYLTLSDFRNNEPGAYSFISKKKLMHLLSGLKRKKLPNGYWNNKKRVFDKASEYASPSDFIENANGAYESAVRNGWWDDIKKNFKRSLKTPWTEKEIKEKIIECGRSKKLFEEKYPGALSAIYKKRWYHLLDMLIKARVPNGHWDIKGNVIDEARRHSNRTQFRKLSSTAYKKAKSHGWLDEACKHMPFNTFEKESSRSLVYAIINERLKLAYIGITNQKFDERVRAHKQKNNDTKSKAIAKEADTVFVALTGYKFSSKNENKGELTASDAEKEYYAWLSKQGYELLNDVSKLGLTPNVNIKWTRQRLKDEASKFKSKKKFADNSNCAYQAALRRGLLNDVCSHMTSKQVPSGTWEVKENILAVARSYKKASDFRKENKGAYEGARRNGWLDEVCGHMESEIRKPGTWTLEKVLEIAPQFHSIKALQNEYGGAASAIYNNHWQQEVQKHLKIRVN